MGVGVLRLLNVDVLVPRTCNVPDPRDLVMTCCEGVVPGATASPPTVWLLPARSSVPPVAASPKVTVPAVGRPFGTPRMIEPP